MYLEFYQFIVLSIIIKIIPFIRIPFIMIATLIHELGHGIMALMTLGNIERITLRLNGSGTCKYRYKSNAALFLISLSGYITTSIIGFSIYYLAKINKDYIAFESIYILLALLLLITVLWIRDYISFIIMILISMLISIPLIQINNVFISQIEAMNFIQLIGVFVMLEGVITPFHLVGNKEDGDSEDLKKLTNIPEIFWIFSWIAIAVYFLYLAYMIN